MTYLYLVLLSVAVAYLLFGPEALKDDVQPEAQNLAENRADISPEVLISWTAQATRK